MQPADPQTAQNIHALTKAYDETTNRNDAAALAALYTADAVFVSDTGPVHGRQAIEKWHAGVFQTWHPQKHLGTVDPDSPHRIGTAGNEIWATGEWSQTGQGETGVPTPIRGYWSALYLREGEEWKIRMLTWNVTPASAPYLQSSQ